MVYVKVSNDEQCFLVDCLNKRKTMTSHSTVSPSSEKSHGVTVKQILVYRDILINLVHRDLTSRYKRSIIGFMWTMLNPVIMTVVYMIVFSTIFRVQPKEFIIYFLSAYLAWNFFSQASSAASKCIMNAGPLVKKICIPKMILVISVIVSAMVNLGAAIVPLLILVAIFGKGLHFLLLFLVVPFVFIFLFTLGISLILASLTVFFLDVGEFYNVILMPWMFMTPIMYPMNIIPTEYLFVIKLNPMYYLIECFRMPIYEGRIPDMSMIVISAIISVVTLAIGYVVFTRNEDDFVYYV
jgi:ABC-2 type transport system permease protein